jgi:RimJ/RimL family protein N-acetyltransferase
MPEIVRGPAYRIETERLVVRCWQPADAPLLKRAVDASLADLQRHLAWALDDPQPLAAKVELLRQFRGKFDLGQEFAYGIFDRGESEVLGGTGIRAGPDDGASEIGYWIASSHQGRSLATEAAASLVRVAFEVDEQALLEIHCDPENPASAAVARKLGFRHEATLKSRVPRRGRQRADRMIWTLLFEDYPSTPCASASVRAFDAVGRTIFESSGPPPVRGRSAFR